MALLVGMLLMAAGASAYVINGLNCPATTVNVTSGVDLSLNQYSTLNTTYLLAPGEYNISNQITAFPGTPEGLCYIAQGPGVIVRSTKQGVSSLLWALN